MDKEEFNLKIGEFIRLQRQSLNFSIRELEKKSGVSKALISRIEGSVSFKTLNPRIHSIKNLLKALNKNLFDLFQYVYQKK